MEIKSKCIEIESYTYEMPKFQLIEYDQHTSVGYMFCPMNVDYEEYFNSKIELWMKDFYRNPRIVSLDYYLNKYYFLSPEDLLRLTLYSHDKEKDSFHNQCIEFLKIELRIKQRTIELEELSKEEFKEGGPISNQKNILRFLELYFPFIIIFPPLIAMLCTGDTFPGVLVALISIPVSIFFLLLFTE